MTLGVVATRAEVTRDTAYGLFVSENELIGEIYLRLIRNVPPCIDYSCGTVARVTAQLRQMALLMATEPEVIAALTCGAGHVALGARNITPVPGPGAIAVV